MSGYLVLNKQVKNLVLTLPESNTVTFVWFMNVIMTIIQQPTKEIK